MQSVDTTVCCSSVQTASLDAQHEPTGDLIHMHPDALFAVNVPGEIRTAPYYSYLEDMLQF